MKKLPLYLVISIPAASVIMGIITLIVALSGPDQTLDATAPLNKTSWTTDIEKADDVD